MTAEQLEEFIERELNRRVINDNGEVVIRFVRISISKRNIHFGIHSDVENKLVECAYQKQSDDCDLRKEAIKYLQAGTNSDRKRTRKDVEEDLRFFARF